MFGMKYTLKVSHKYIKEIYRIIEVSGETTLDRLHEIIIEAFGFSDDHLYMFSLKRKKYDQDGFYAPGSGCGGQSAAEVKLGELGLKPRNKILFLYDFGDEWQFNVAVSKIAETETGIKHKVIDSQGELEQYGCWDEEDYDESPFAEEKTVPENVDLMIGDQIVHIDFGLEEDILQLGKMTGKTVILYQSDFYRVEKCESDMVGILCHVEDEDLECLLEALNIEKPDDQQYAKALASHYRENPQRVLEILTAEDILFLHQLLNKDYRGFMRGHTVNSSAWHLQALGLMQISAEEIFYFEIAEDLYVLADPVEKIIKNQGLAKECEAEQIFRALLSLYIVVERDCFRQLVSEVVQWEVKEDFFEEFLVKKNLLWHRLFCYQDNAGNDYYTCCMEETMQQVLENRQKYKVKHYKKFDREYCLGLIQNGEQTTTWCKRLAREFRAYVWNDAFAERIVADIEDFVRIGCDEDEFLDRSLGFLRELKINETQKIRGILRKLHATYPSGGLKGHNWHDNSRNDGSSQLSMFDDLSFFSI